MATTREHLERITGNLEESLGRRQTSAVPLPVPVPEPRDIGRRPARNAGCIPIDRVVADPDQPRQEFSEESLQQLAQSLRDNGQLSPVRVRWSESLDRWVIVFGERRWRAAQRAGLPEIDCVFLEDELPQTEILEQQLIENCLREDLQPIELARGLTALMELHDWNGKQVAAALHLPASKVSRVLALLKLPPDVQQQVAEGDIPERTAYELSKLTCEATVRRLAEQASTGRLTTDQAAKTIRRRRGRQSRTTRKLRQTFLTESGWTITATGQGPRSYHDLEQALQESLDEVRHRIANGIRLF